MFIPKWYVMGQLSGLWVFRYSSSQHMLEEFSWKIGLVAVAIIPKKFEICGWIRQLAQIFYEIIEKITTSPTGSTAVSCPASWGYSRLFFRACFQRPKMTKARLCKVWWCTKHIVAKNLSRDCYCTSVSGLLSTIYR